MRGTTGYFIPKNPHKCMNWEQPVMFRSMLESQMMSVLDCDSNVRFWGYELVVIPYVYEGKPHRYYVDFLVEFMDGEHMLIEVKPLSIIQRLPTWDDSIRKQYKVNEVKWDAAVKWCLEKNYTFRLAHFG